METMHGWRMARLILMFVRISWARKQASSANKRMEGSICNSIPGCLSGLRSTTYTPHFMYFYNL
jgi:hypothetical protein